MIRQKNEEFSLRNIKNNQLLQNFFLPNVKTFFGKARRRGRRLGAFKETPTNNNGTQLRIMLTTLDYF